MPNNEIVTAKKGSLASHHDAMMERLSGILGKFEEMEGVLEDEQEVVHQEEAAIRSHVLELMAYAKLPYAQDRGFYKTSVFSKGLIFKRKVKDITHLYTAAKRGKFLEDRKDVLDDGIDRVAWSEDGDIFVRRQFNSIRNSERHALGIEIDYDMGGNPDGSRLRQWVRLEDARDAWKEFDIRELIEAMRLAIPECERQIEKKKMEIDKRRSTATSVGR